MRRHQDIGIWIVQLMLLAAVSGRPAETPRPTVLVVDQPVSWSGAEARDLRCFPVDVPAPGHYWLALRSDRPSTAPSVMVLDGRGRDPRTVERVEATLLQVERPGRYLVCLTSDADPGNVELVFQRAGDPLEIEEVIDP